MRDSQTVWKKVKALLKERLEESVFTIWIEQLLNGAVADGKLILSCDNSFALNRVKSHHLSEIQTALDEVAGDGNQMEIKLTIAKENENPPNKKTKPVTKKTRQMQLPSLGNQTSARPMLQKLRGDFTLAELVIGDFNQFAHDVTINLLEAKNVFQPILLYAKTGYGKSHIEQAMALHAQTSGNANKVLYITASAFTDEFIAACRNNVLDQFKKKFREGCDVLFIDDVHFLGGKTKTQIELHLIIDHLLNNGKKIIFSSTLLPAEIPRIDKQLTSRFMSSIISEITLPDFSNRVKILEKIAATSKQAIPGDVLEYLADALDGDIRQLKSGILTLISRHSLANTPLDILNAQMVAANLVQSSKRITATLIAEIVAKEFGLKVSDLTSRSRAKTVLIPRQIAMHLCQEHTDLTLKAIGGIFNRQHATAINALNQASQKMIGSTTFRKQVEIIENKLQKIAA